MLDFCAVLWYNTTIVSSDGEAAGGVRDPLKYIFPIYLLGTPLAKPLFKPFFKRFITKLVINYQKRC
jgi:hypothetical protein